MAEIDLTFEIHLHLDWTPTNYSSDPVVHHCCASTFELKVEGTECHLEFVHVDHSVHHALLLLIGLDVGLVDLFVALCTAGDADAVAGRGGVGLFAPDGTPFVAVGASG